MTKKEEPKKEENGNKTHYEIILEELNKLDNKKEYLMNISFEEPIEKESDAIIIKELMMARDLYKSNVLKNIDKNKEEIDSYHTGVNWVDDLYCSTWKKTKRKNYSQLKGSDHLFFLAHNNDEIEGKPQLVNDVKMRMPLITKTEKKVKDDLIVGYKFIDDKYDKRTDGYEVDVLDSSFWVYRTICNGEEYILFSKEDLGIEYSKFTGMEVKINNLSEMSKNLKMRGISKIFFVKEVKPSIIIYDQEQLIEFTKKVTEKIGLDKEKFLDFIFAHEDGRIYRHSEIYELVRVAQLLSGKYEGYPLNILNMGPPGKGKTCELEALDLKFKESAGILEAGNSTTKALIPSFKEKPANPGYILRCRRVALIDELMKMVHKIMEYGRSDQRTQNHLQELNPLLEHKVRGMGSGNDNFFITNPTAKVIFATNPLPGKRNIYQHVGVIDESMLSRIIILIQDDDEKNFVDKNIPRKYNLKGENTKNTLKITGNTQQHTYIYYINHILYQVCVPSELIPLIEPFEENIFMTIYDSCQNFVCNLDEKRINEISNKYVKEMKEPLKTIFQKRMMHHSFLILDGLVKFRCLFEDFDDKFVVKEEDYALLERILLKIVRSWDCRVDIAHDEGMF